MTAYISKGLADSAALSSPDGLEFIIAEIVRTIRRIQQQLEGGTGDLGTPPAQLVPDVGITRLADLEDVSLLGPTTGQALVFNGLTWGSANIATSLVELTDTNIVSPSSNQFLRFIGGEWVNSTFTLELNDISNVNAPSPGAGAFLRYVGSNWVPAGLDTPDTAEDILNSLPSGAPTVGDPMSWVTVEVCIDGVSQSMQVLARYTP